MFAWQFAKALYLADRRGWSRFGSMQTHYSLLYREEEREMNPLCRAEGVAITPWSPLGAGYLTRPHEEFTSTTRGVHETENAADAVAGSRSFDIPVKVADRSRYIHLPRIGRRYVIELRAWAGRKNRVLCRSNPVMP